MLDFSKRLQNLGQGILHAGRRHDLLICHPAQQVFIQRIQQIQFRASLYSLTQALREQWLILAQIASYHQDTIQFLHRSYALTQPRRSSPGAIRSEIGLASAVVHVATAQAANKFLQQIQFFQCAVRGRQRANLESADLADLARIVDACPNIHGMVGTSIADHPPPTRPSP